MTVTTSAKDDVPAGPPQVLCLGMLRTGTLSLATALETLGFKTFHALNLLEDKPMWVFIERAAEATWPAVVPGRQPQPRPFGRAEWNASFGRFDALTDIACFFAPQLIEAYPDAKVVLTTRDYDRWYASYDDRVLHSILATKYGAFVKAASYVLNHRALFAMEKVIRGYYDIGPAGTLEDAEARTRDAFHDHYARIKATVPSERLLEYQVGRDGWEPLCKFLNRPVPTTDSPRLNDSAAHKSSQNKRLISKVLNAAIKVIVYASPVFFALVVWYFWRAGQ